MNEFDAIKKEHVDNLIAGEINEVDKELRSLIMTMNEITGLYTIECCVGHGKQPCRIWFKTYNFEVLHKFCFNCLNCWKQWKICYDNGDIHRDEHFSFYLESTTSDMKVIGDIVKQLEQNIRRELDNGNLKKLDLGKTECENNKQLDIHHSIKLLNNVNDDAIIQNIETFQPSFEFKQHVEWVQLVYPWETINLKSSETEE